MLGVLEVKGEATLASDSEREIPAWADFRAWGEGEREREKEREREREKEVRGRRILGVLIGRHVTYPTVISTISTHRHSIAGGQRVRERQTEMEGGREREREYEKREEYMYYMYM